MLDSTTIHELASIVGADNILTEKQDLICYSYDATQMEFLPDAVVHPADAAEVSAVLKLANRCGFPVFPRGAGSGFTGGALPKAGGVVLVVTRMNRILRIDPQERIAVVEAGAVNLEVQSILFDPVTPSRVWWVSQVYGPIPSTSDSTERRIPTPNPTGFAPVISPEEWVASLRAGRIKLPPAWNQPFEVLQPAHLVGRARTNTTLVDPTIVQTDVLPPCGMSRSVSAENVGATTLGHGTVKVWSGLLIWPTTLVATTRKW